MNIDCPPYRLKIATTEEEQQAAQRLRYKVFVEEMGATCLSGGAGARLEKDAYDPYCDHIILIDQTVTEALDSVVGVYRVMTEKVAQSGIGFYSANEFELKSLQQSGKTLLELGRSCVHPDHRGGQALSILWNGLAHYVENTGSEILFGTASFAGNEPQDYAHSLAYLHHFHLTAVALDVRAKDTNFIDMNCLPIEIIDRRQALANLPPLLKAYLRLGGKVGRGAWLDHRFNTIDVCMILDVADISIRQRSLYSKIRDA
ncbi:MAG: GNAT family N-acyltransferase [Pseudomonadota bacterium]